MCTIVWFATVTRILDRKGRSVLRFARTGLIDRLDSILLVGGIPMYHAGAGGRDYPTMIEEYLLDPAGVFYDDSSGIVMNEMRDLSGGAMSVLNASPPERTGSGR